MSAIIIPFPKADEHAIREVINLIFIPNLWVTGFTTDPNQYLKEIYPFTTASKNEIHIP